MFLKVDHEIKSNIPPLSIEEYQQLEQNIIADGCRDAIVIWNDTILDGHNRYEICNKHNLPFKTHTFKFQNKDEAIIWVIHRKTF